MDTPHCPEFSGQPDTRGGAGVSGARPAGQRRLCWSATVTAVLESPTWFSIIFFGSLALIGLGSLFSVGKGCAGA